MYNSLIPLPRSGSETNLVRIGSRAASVLPLAVGEIRRTFLPSSMWGMACDCASVGIEKPRSIVASTTGLASRSTADKDDAKDCFKGQAATIKAEEKQLTVLKRFEADNKNAQEGRFRE